MVIELSPQETTTQLQERCLLIDVREAYERLSGYIAEASHIPRSELAVRIAAQAPDLNTPIVCHCQSGYRSKLAAQALQDLGYTQVSSLQGGIQAWKDAGLPIAHEEHALSEQELQRYARHLSVPEIGPAGQLALRDARVCMVGAGGLGSPATLYLAAAGVGHLRIIDADAVELSNLQRQVLHTTARIGTPKVESARACLRDINPEITIDAVHERVATANAADLFADADIIIDGSDNFATRYVVNDACLALGKAFVFGSVYRFEGQVSVFTPGNGPCYRCLFPEAPPPAAAPSCAEAGVLGAIPGIVGCLQATEAIKQLLNIGQSLQGRLLSINALTMEFRTLQLATNPDCACQTRA